MAILEAQTLSIAVPGIRCINQCEPCVSGMHGDAQYANLIGDYSSARWQHYFEEYVKRIGFAQANNVNIMMITGAIEPMQNLHFLNLLALINQYHLPRVFPCIEIQTAGNDVDQEHAEWLARSIKVTTLSLSMFSFLDTENQEIVHCKKPICIKDVCSNTKSVNMNLRLSLNMSNFMYNSFGGDFDRLFDMLHQLGADQVTFRKLFAKGDSPQSKWVRENDVPKSVFEDLNDYIIKHGKEKEVLPYGYQRYSMDGISVVVDPDCMNQEKKQREVAKYFVLRPNCKLYRGWEPDDLLH